MRINFKNIWIRLLELLRLSPLSLAEKCRLAFGAAVVFILIIALLLLYFWMGQLTKKASLDASSAKAETLLRSHFQLRHTAEQGPASLGNSGVVLDANGPEIRWIRLNAENQSSLNALSEAERARLEALTKQGSGEDILLVKKDDGAYTSYVKIFTANDNCLSCHNPQGTAKPFGRNEPVGAVFVRRPAGEITRIALMNKLYVIIVGLIGGAGAIIAFYIITQRVILRPIRQLRALANNVAEGNLDIRSSINTRDEYQKLADAFNHMLDGLQGGQEKLRQANKQLDAKIAELSERNIELFKANKIKSEFLANISHEFRTPLNAIIGFAEILREKAADAGTEKSQRYVSNIITGGKRLLNMVNDLLDLAKTEAGKMQLHIEKTSVAELCDNLASTFSALTKENKIKVRVNISEDIPELVTDAGKVQQILYNFFSNAVKFTPPGGKIEIKATMPDDKHIRIAVSDTGCGIAEVDKEKIFEKFRQADGSLTRRSGGSGLGLAISKELAGMLAGSVGMESELNEGSVFWLDIPVVLSRDQEKA